MISPAEQHTLLGEITVLLVAELPPGWRRLIVDYAVREGRVSVSSGLRMADGTTASFRVPKTAAPLYSRLRSGMRDAWHTLELIVDPPDRFTARFNGETAGPAAPR